ncbi:MAG: DUF4064 domain-containing protein [Eubacteriales bacterium]
MRKASMVLGIIGGVLGILAALLSFAMGSLFKSDALTDMMEQSIEIAEADPEFAEAYGDMDIEYELNSEEFEMGTKMAGGILNGIGIFMVIASVLGIIGAAIVNKNNIAAGVMMLLAGIGLLFTVWGILSFILFLLGGIFAFVKDNSQPEPQPMEQY